MKKKTLIYLMFIAIRCMAQENVDLNGYWKITNPELPEIHYWIFEIDSDTSSKFLFDFSRKYELDLIQNSIELPISKDHCNIQKISENRIDILCKDVKSFSHVRKVPPNTSFVASRISNLEYQEHRHFIGPPRVNLPIPNLAFEDSLFNSLSDFGDRRSLVHIFVGPYLRGYKQFRVSTHLYVGGSSGIIGMGDISRTYKTGNYTRRNTNNAIEGRLREYNKTNESQAVLHVDELVHMKELREILYRLNSIKSIKTILFVLQTNDSKSFSIKYLLLKPGNIIRADLNMTFADWVKSDCPMGVPEARSEYNVLEIVE